jgi:outer membrane protein OmpA-like peptidoglycan-associated protein
MRKLLTICSICIAFSLNAQQADSVVIEITNLGKEVNSAFADFAPVTSADGSLMIFTSKRPATEKEIRKNSESSERIYSTEFNSKNNTWSSAVLLPEPVNTKGRNNSAIALSNDGQHMLIYHDDFNGNGDIYESRLKGTLWSDPVRLPDPVNTEFHESSASISPDGKTIYFVSDRPGGEGGRDIWFSKKDETGKWGKAENIGHPINTEGDEEGIFIHPDGTTIYFSSKRPEGLGGFDIYRSEFKKEGVWSVPQNLEAPLNTAGDDVFFVMQANGKTGYYSSSMSGGNGDKDIYRVNFIHVKKEIKPSGPKLMLLKGLVLDEEKLTPLGAVLEITDNEKHEVISNFNSNSSTGKFIVSLPAGKNYGITVKAEGYLFYSDNFNLPDTAAYQEVERNVLLKKLVVGKKIVLKNIFYDFNKSTLTTESVSELNQMVSLLKENASIKIELSSYTDSKGADDYNKKLSQARAQSVVNYLIGKGIAKDRLVAVGYGETFPIAGNDTEEGRQLNRRTEFKILSK